MQTKPTIQELEFRQNISLWPDNSLRLKYKENQAKVKQHIQERYSWRDIQGLSWIFENEFE